jgi:hypothetical protein
MNLHPVSQSLADTGSNLRALDVAELEGIEGGCPLIVVGIAIACAFLLAHD